MAGTLVAPHWSDTTSHRRLGAAGPRTSPVDGEECRLGRKWGRCRRDRKQRTLPRVLARGVGEGAVSTARWRSPISARPSAGRRRMVNELVSDGSRQPAAARGPSDAHVSDVARATLSSGESTERGRAARAMSPRSAHGDWAPAADRPDPVAVLAAQAASRVQELVPIRYGRMLVSPFTFYRGAAAVMAADLAATPDSGIVVQACGDAHISNFGGFAAPDRRLVFGPNDFDETLPGPWEWDVKRMAASVEIAGRDVGLPADRRRRIVTACVREYREGMRGFANESHLDVWYDRLTASELVDRFGGRLGAKGRIVFAKPFARARRKTSLRAVEEAHRARRRRAALPQRPAAAGARSASCSTRPTCATRRRTSRSCWTQYAAGLDPDRRFLFETYRFVDMARKVVGVGSVGTRAWVVPARRPRGEGPARAAGEGGAGLGARALPGRERVRQPRRARRARPADLARGERHLPRAGSAAKASTARSTTSTCASSGTGRRPPTCRRMSEAGLHAYTRACGWSLARAHARSGDRLAIAGLPGRRLAASTGRSPASQRRTPIRTSSTTSGWPRPSPRAKSSPNSASDD